MKSVDVHDYKAEGRGARIEAVLASLMAQLDNQAEALQRSLFEEGAIPALG